MSCNVPKPDMVLIPAGEFKVGLKTSGHIPEFLSERTSSENAQPMHNALAEAFYMDIYEVTYADFLKFKSHANYVEGQGHQPVRGVSWYEADAYCLWLGKRLPTEFEWEKSARGRAGQIYTWGNKFQRENANFGKTVLPGGQKKTDQSVFGNYDMNGNVSEWTASWYQPYPNSTYQDKNYGEKYRVIRGGAINKREHGFLEEFARLSFRNFGPPTHRSWDTGFRCAKSP